MSYKRCTQGASMSELKLIDKLREFLKTAEGKELTLSDIRNELRIDPASSAWNSLRTQMFRLTEEKIVKPTGRKDGTYKVIQQVKPVKVFGRKKSEPFRLRFPKDYSTQKEMKFAGDIIFRQGDMILISGRSNFGKTALCMNILAENIDACPVIMGNEYTTIDHEPTDRFVNRIEKMDWVEWIDDGDEKFTLLPVRDDYAEHVVKDKINIIDWINLEEHYQISKIMESIKRELGKGIAVVAIQKAEGADSGRGGQFTKDFADVEILIDQYGDTEETLLKIGKVKESTRRVSGRAFVFTITEGVMINNFREVFVCKKCKGKKYIGVKKCNDCDGFGYIES